MSLLARGILLISAALCGGFFALSGAGLSWALEPEQYSARTLMSWLLAGVVLAVPLWVPAVFPSRHARGLTICRRVCVVLLLFPTWLFGSIVVHNLGRALSGMGMTPVALVQGSVLTFCCLVSLCVLLLPEFRRHTAHRLT